MHASDDSLPPGTFSVMLPPDHEPATFHPTSGILNLGYVRNFEDVAQKCVAELKLFLEYINGKMTSKGTKEKIERKRYHTKQQGR